MEDKKPKHIFSYYQYYFKKISYILFRYYISNIFFDQLLAFYTIYGIYNGTLFNK